MEDIDSIAYRESIAAHFPQVQVRTGVPIQEGWGSFVLEVNGEHILCDPAAGRVNGIIDWADAAIGDPAIDFVGILWACGPAFARQVLERYPGPADEGLWSRATFYLRIVPTYEVRYGLDTGRPEYVEEGLADLRCKPTI